MIKFAATASTSELTAIESAFGQSLVERSVLIESTGCAAMGKLHENLQSELGFRQRRQLVNAYRAKWQVGSRRWMVGNLPDYPVRFAAACNDIAAAQRGMLDEIMRTVYERPVE